MIEMANLRKSRTKALLAVLVLMTTMVLGACTQPQPPAPPTPPAPPSKFGGVLKVAINGNPPTLDMFRTTSTLTTSTMHHAMETLFTIGPDYEPYPHLVKDYTISPDGKVWTFNLRRGVRFHDGSEMVADDVIASLEQFGTLQAIGRSLFKIKQSLVAKDKYTVVLTLTEPTALVPAYLTHTGAIVVPKYTIDEAAGAELKRFIGTGPFKFAGYEPDRYLKFVRFADYSAIPGEPKGHGGNRTAYVDELVMYVVPDAAVRTTGVQTGEYHFGWWITPDDYSWLKNTPGIVSYVRKPSAWPAAFFNKATGLFTDVRLRQAFLAALDMEPLMRAAYGDQIFWRLDHAIMNQEQTPWYHEAGKELYNQNNPERARQLLTEAGYKGEPVRWLTTTEFPAYYAIAQIAKPQLERAGFVIELQVVDWATLVSRSSQREGWNVYSTALPLVLDPLLHSSLYLGGSGFYESAKMEALLAELRRETNYDKRYEIFGKVQALFYEEVPVVKFGDFFLYLISREELKGYQPRPPQMYYWNCWLEPK